MENPVKYLVFAYIIFKMQIGYVQLYSAVPLSFRLVSVCILIHSYTQHLHFALICILYYIRCVVICVDFSACVAITNTVIQLLVLMLLLLCIVIFCTLFTSISTICYIFFSRKKQNALTIKYILQVAPGFQHGFQLLL